MTRRGEVEDLTKITTRIFTRDKEILDRMYPNQGVQKAIRYIIRTHLQKIAAVPASNEELVSLVDLDDLEEAITDE